jgi:hypothetical protein
MRDGSTRTVTLQGVGCTASICSRVRARGVTSENVWLDGIDSVRGITGETDGAVTAYFTFKDGTERQASIIHEHRILYIRERFGPIDKLDLASITRIDFDRSSHESSPF